jgi:uncharacterized membrane protein
LLAALTAAFTIIIRIPIPGTGGYLNIGDMAVVFCGLFLGGRKGALAGGLGSAIADLIGGFFMFAPITFVAKGLEAYIAGTLGKKKLYWVGMAVSLMVIVYFISEIFLPGMGFSAALSELPFNIIQATVGAFGGIAVYKGVSLAFPSQENQG